MNRETLQRIQYKWLGTYYHIAGVAYFVLLILLIFFLITSNQNGIQSNTAVIFACILISTLAFTIMFIIFFIRLQNKERWISAAIWIFIMFINVSCITISTKVLRLPKNVVCQKSCNQNEQHYVEGSICGWMEAAFIVSILELVVSLLLTAVLYGRDNKKNNLTVILSNYFNKKNKSSNVILQNEQNRTTYLIPPNLSIYDSNSNAVGIDFGTTECCAAVIRKSGPDCVALDLMTSLRTLPSYIGYDERNPKCGQLVINRMRHHAAHTVFDAKRLLGKKYEEIAKDSAWPFSIEKCEDSVTIQFSNGDPKTPEEVSGELLKHIKLKLEEYQNRILEDAVIAIPSTFSEKQKVALFKAANLAGWKRIQYIPEPIAAAYAYYQEMQIPNNSKMLVFDFGGGTVDVCIVEIKDGRFVVLNFNGNYYLGGRDFDSLLYTHFDGILKHTYNIDVSKINKKYFLLQKCQEIKHTLSCCDNFEFDVSDFDINSNEQINITRQEFEDIAEPHKTRIINVIVEAIQAANLQRDEIDLVVQVGGSSRMPLIKKILIDLFTESKLKCCKTPEEIVAQGAALFAYHFVEQQIRININE